MRKPNLQQATQSSEKSCFWSFEQGFGPSQSSSKWAALFSWIPRTHCLSSVSFSSLSEYGSLETGPMLVCQSCHYKAPQTGELQQGINFHPVLEAGSPASRSRRVWSESSFLGLPTATFSLCPHTASSL